MKKIIISLLIIILVLLNIAGCKDKEEKKEDAIKFKKEYEVLNGTSNDSGKEHRTLTILEDNPFIYITSQEIISKIKNKESFYIYFGSAYCPWCRSVIEQAIKTAKENNIKTIYYFDIWDGDHVEILRDEYKLNDKNEVELVSKGTSEYQELLKYFDNVLEDYTLTDENGTSVAVGEKRIFAPTFIFIQNGKAIKLETGISDKQKDSREELNTKIIKDETKKFNDFYQK